MQDMLLLTGSYGAALAKSDSVGVAGFYTNDARITIGGIIFEVLIMYD